MKQQKVQDDYIIVLDLDDTLIADDYKPFKGASDFIKNVAKLGTTGIWTGGNQEHLRASIENNFRKVEKYLSFQLAGVNNGKPVNVLKRNNIHGLFYVLVDDLESNNIGYHFYVNPLEDSPVPNYTKILHKIKTFISIKCGAMKRTTKLDSKRKRVPSRRPSIIRMK